jgi:predicted NBD/HSP70 family sugar kinase
VEPAKPSLELLRSLTDEHVLRALMRHKRLTRAEVAAETGISKPTVGAAVRRLTEAGLVVDTGERTAGGRGRGRVGSYYALSEDTGTAVAISIAPEGVVAERVDAHGETVSRVETKIDEPAQPSQVATALCDAMRGPAPRLAVVSAADPVDRATGRLVQLPDAPFLLGELDTTAILAPRVDGPVIVDNDVNWAAQAEHDVHPSQDFAYVYLGAGMGCAIVSDGEVKRGGSGLAGEIAHLVTVGPQGKATRLIEVFDELSLRRDDSTAIDVDRLLAAASGPTLEAVADAISGVLAAIVAITDPETIVIGGPWGSHAAVLDAIAAAFARLPRHVPVRPATLTTEPSLTGARTTALARLRAAVIATTSPAG